MGAPQSTLTYGKHGAVYQHGKPINFEAKVADFSAKIEAETEGLLSIEPADLGCVNMLYRGKWLAKLHICGLKTVDVYELIHTIYKACILYWSTEFLEDLGI